MPVSFYDTGFQEVGIVTHLIDGDSLISTRYYYVLSKFKQNDIMGNYGDSLELSAEPFNPGQDRDVRYVWKIGNTVVESEKSTAFISIDEPLLDDRCTLRIFDLQKQYCSPPVFFKTVLSDTVKPEIIIQNPFSNDTIYVPGDTLQLKVKIKKSFGTTTVYADGAMMTRTGSNSFVHIISSGNKQNTLIDIVAVAGSDNRSNREVCVVFNSNVLQYVKPVIEPHRTSGR